MQNSRIDQIGTENELNWLSPNSNSTDGSFKEVTDRGDSPFPDIEMHLATFMGIRTNNISTESETFDLDEMRKKSQFLEDCNKAMNKRNQNLIVDNKTLNNQLALMTTKIKKLEEVIITLQKTQCNNTEYIQMGICKPDLKDAETSTADNLLKFEKDICKMCEREIEFSEIEEPTLTITKSELEKLENDMQTLRDSVVAREKSWDRAAKREQNYRQQLVKFSVEAITNRQLLESYNEQLQNTIQELADKTTELKSLRKECAMLKKQKERHTIRNTEENQESKSERLIDDIKQQLSNTRGKQRSKPKNSLVDKPHVGSLTSSSQYASPRDKNVGYTKESTSTMQNIQ